MHKIVLTGGPCAGKTTALSKIDNELTNMGYKVFIIDEVATRIINEGIRPFGEGKISMLDFERILLKKYIHSFTTTDAIRIQASVISVEVSGEIILPIELFRSSIPTSRITTEIPRPATYSYLP